MRYEEKSPRQPLLISSIADVASIPEEPALLLDGADAIAWIPSVLVGSIGPAPTPGVGDDAVFFDEVLDTAKYMHEVACTLNWDALGRTQ